MIVDPDFLDHWRTRMVVDALHGDELAPLYIIRLWGHCQNRKSDTFEIPSAGIKALCKFSGDAALLEKALIDGDFISRDGQSVTVVGWSEKNASLIAAWKNGSTGGRPKKNPAETHGKPMGNPWETDGEPSENPSQTGSKPIREEKRREELTTTTPNGVVGGNVVALPKQKPDCPHQEIIAIYHEVLPMCPRIREWTPTRATHLRARWNEDERRQNLDYWRKFFEYVRECEFLTGRAHGNGRRPFFADLEWMVKASNFTKIREGKYAND
ncbi:hypothetical protein [Herbaspirillum aquaticum]|uniref:hypothetical protein n=1 Tax=Herbaspirillum aquaticum TaxID=568783 RepID=UPI0024DEC464|nr:hypothetical protein [Herbaspirillum aquaticum]